MGNPGLGSRKKAQPSQIIKKNPFATISSETIRTNKKDDRGEHVSLGLGSETRFGKQMLLEWKILKLQWKKKSVWCLGHLNSMYKLIFVLPITDHNHFHKS